MKLLYYSDINTSSYHILSTCVFFNLALLNIQHIFHAIISITLHRVLKKNPSSEIIVRMLRA